MVVFAGSSTFVFNGGSEVDVEIVEDSGELPENVAEVVYVGV
jgi:hypothetical protein